MLDFRESAPGLVKRAGVVLNARARGLLSQRTWNQVVKLGLGHALWVWIDECLAKRWDPSYVRSLGYSGKSRTPYFQTGDFLRAAMAFAHPRVTATDGMARGAVVVPVTHPMAEGALLAFKTVPTAEARLVANAFLQAARKVLAGGVILQATEGARGKAKMRQVLSADLAKQAAALSAKGNPYGPNAGRAAQAKDMAANLAIDRARAMRQGSPGHRVGISGGDAPGSGAAAAGRGETQLAANFRYRHTAGGRAMRAKQAVRYRMYHNVGGRAAWLASYGIHLKSHAA